MATDWGRVGRGVLLGGLNELSGAETAYQGVKDAGDGDWWEGAKSILGFADVPKDVKQSGAEWSNLPATNDLIATMQGRVAGTAPSPAELQMRAGLDRQRAMAESLAHSGAGAYNPGLARRQALRAQGEAGAQYNADAGILRAQEQAAAESRLAALLGQGQVQGRFERGLDQAQFNQDQQRNRNFWAGVVETAATVSGLPKAGARPMAYGEIVAGPTQALIGEGGRPEAVIPLTSPADAALAARMIEKARMRIDAEQRARALAMLATRLTEGKVHRGSAAGVGEAGQAGARMGDYATMITGGGRPTRADAADYGRRMGALAARLTGER